MKKNFLENVSYKVSVKFMEIIKITFKVYQMPYVTLLCLNMIYMLVADLHEPSQ